MASSPDSGSAVFAGSSQQSAHFASPETLPAPGTRVEPAEGLPAPRTGHTPRHELKALAAGMGADEVKAERVAEAALRRIQARDEGRMFIYVDVEYELEDLYRAGGASPEQIAAAKQRVWEAAREISVQRELPIEEALFFCFHEAADAHRRAPSVEAA
jgi:hypothetical protein